MIFYDMECEQTIAGLPLLICCVVWSVVKGFVDVAVENKFSQDVHSVVYFHGMNCVKDFLEFLFTVPQWTRCQRNYLMGFNNYKFDDLYLVQEIQNEYDCIQMLKSLTAKSGRILELTFKAIGHSTIHSKDLIKYIPGGQNLASIGKTVKLPKLIGEIDFKQYNAKNPLYALKYCARDVCITVEGWFGLARKQWEPICGTLFQDTVSVIEYTSQSQIAYNCVLYECPGMYPLTDQGYKYARQAYFGAKTDSCIYGQERVLPVSVWDYSSLYPSMVDAMPIGQEVWLFNYPVKFDKTFNPYDYKPFVCTVVLEKPMSKNHFEQGNGVLPIHVNNQLFYLNSGKVKGVYTSRHIYVAIQDGWTVKRAWNFMFTQKWSLAPRRFYAKWYAIKQQYEKDSTWYWAAKMILNSSIGYFGLKHDVNNYKNLMFACFNLANTCQYQLLKKQYLMSVQCYGIYYEDTDSMVISTECMNRLVAKYPEMLSTETVLGNINTLKGEIEAHNQPSVVVLAKKMYHCHKKFGCKGHHHSVTYDYMKSCLKEPKLTHSEKVDKLQVGNNLFIGKFVPTKRIMKHNVPIMKIYCNQCKRFITKHVIMKSK